MQDGRIFGSALKHPMSEVFQPTARFGMHRAAGLCMQRARRGRRSWPTARPGASTLAVVPGSGRVNVVM